VWRLVEPLARAASAAPADPGALALDAEDRAARRKTHDTIRRVTGDLYPRVHLNTAISALMELVNDLYAYAEARGVLRAGRRAEEAGPATIDRAETAAVLREAFDALVRLIAPFAPHMAEELWEHLGHEGGLAAASWPSWDAAVAKQEEVVIPVQVNGKVRARLTASADATDAELEAMALAHPQVQAHTAGRTIDKIVVVKGRLVGVVVK
jgi:leucyl-tRNA synthetase